MVIGEDEIFLLYVLFSVWIVVFVWVMKFCVGVWSLWKFLWWVIFWMSVSMCCRKVVLVVCKILFLRIFKLIVGWKFLILLEIIGVVELWVRVFCCWFKKVGVFVIIGFFSLFIFEVGLIGFIFFLGFCVKGIFFGLFERLFIVFWLVGWLLILGFCGVWLLMDLLGLCMLVWGLLVFLIGLVLVWRFLIGFL